MIKLIQRAGQWVLLRLENGGNALFGEAQNPLYYLGGITFLLYWVVVGSGFFIYAFFKTGVDEAYNSVEYITHTQWYLGGVMRSLHRYAADGMVITILLHLTRNFMFDRYHGFRAMSWITGTVLLWLTYISGVNGYWLVWDKMAQFVAVATAEWLDWFPIFNGVLVRNFMYQGSVNDRFFSLLAFAHIGIPLILLFFIWIHTQRVPHARIYPPRQTAVALLLSLLALALIKPAVSQGQADLGTAPTTLNFDWFFLAVYPLIYNWSPGKLWALIGGVTLVVVVQPWLSRPKRLPEGEFQITSKPCNHIVTARPGETILDAALRQGLMLPYLCRDGACGTCKGTVLQGSVDYGTYQQSALSEAEKQAGKALFCCARPLSDVDIECHEVYALKNVPVKRYTSSVQRIERVAPDVMVVSLKLADGEALSFLPGQHISVLLEDGKRRSFSIANPPHVNDRVELHIRRVEGGRFTGHVFTKMKAGDVVQFEGPLGSFFLREESHKPIILMAGGTGFSPIKSIVEHVLHTGGKRRMLLYWGGRARKDLYMMDLAQTWQREHEFITFIPVLSEAAPADNWDGKTGFVHEAVLKDHETLKGHEVYACGPPPMVAAGRETFIQRGLPEAAYFADAFLQCSYSTDETSKAVTHG